MSFRTGQVAECCFRDFCVPLCTPLHLSRGHDLSGSPDDETNDFAFFFPFRSHSIVTRNVGKTRRPSNEFRISICPGSSHTSRCSDGIIGVRRTRKKSSGRGFYKSTAFRSFGPHRRCVSPTRLRPPHLRLRY